MSSQERRTRRSFSDPTAQAVIGNVRFERIPNDRCNKDKPKINSPYSPKVALEIRARFLGELSTRIGTMPRNDPLRSRFVSDFNRLVALQTAAKNKSR